MSYLYLGRTAKAELLRYLILKVRETFSLIPDGGVAQLGEHLPCKQGVRSSILLISTNG